MLLTHLNLNFNMILPNCFMLGLKWTLVMASLCPLKCLSKAGSSCKDFVNLFYSKLNKRLKLYKCQWSLKVVQSVQTHVKQNPGNVNKQ